MSRTRHGHVANCFLWVGELGPVTAEEPVEHLLGISLASSSQSFLSSPTASNGLLAVTGDIDVDGVLLISMLYCGLCMPAVIGDGDIDGVL